MPDNVSIQGIEFEIVGTTGKATRGLGSLIKKLQELKAIAQEGLHLEGITKELSDLANSVQLSSELALSLKRVAQVTAALSNAAGRTKTNLNGMNGALMKTNATLNKMTSVTANVDGGKEVGGVSGFLSSLKQGFQRLGEPVSHANKKLHEFGRSIKRITMYRIVRGIIKEIGEAIRTGVNNLYQWSKALNGDFAQSMDKLATSAQYLKNSLAAAFAPLITKITPYIDAFVDRLVDMINYINMAIAALSGAHTWTRAKKVATEYAEAVDNVTGSVKELLGLASFDKLNNLTQGGGRGGGASTPDYGSMFEEVELTSKDVAEAFDNLRDLALKVGLAIAGWKIASSFFGDLDKANGLMTTLLLGGTVLLTLGIKSFLENGGTKENLLEIGGGAAAITAFIMNALGFSKIASIGWGLALGATVSLTLWLGGKLKKNPKDSLFYGITSFGVGTIALVLGKILGLGSAAGWLALSTSVSVMLSMFISTKLGVTEDSSKAIAVAAGVASLGVGLIAAVLGVPVIGAALLGLTVGILTTLVMSWKMKQKDSDPAKALITSGQAKTIGDQAAVRALFTVTGKSKGTTTTRINNTADIKTDYKFSGPNFKEALQKGITGGKDTVDIGTIKVRGKVEHGGISGTFATGGYPTTGQYFIARESGPELVGRIGNKTAVVNNDQIVASVSDGVYEGVYAAMMAANNGANVTVTLQGDAKGIFNAVRTEDKNFIRQNGHSAFAY